MMQGGFGASNDAVNRIRKCLCKTEELSGSKDFTACGLWRAMVLQKKEKEKKAWLQQLLLDGKKMVTYSL